MRGKSAHDLSQVKHYDEIAKQRLTLDPKKQATPAAARELERLLRFINLKDKSSVLEIGCGTGGMTLPLLRQGHKVLGTEISKDSIDALKKFAKQEGLQKKLSTLKDDFASEKKTRKYEGKFDLALFIGVIHHLDPGKKEVIFRNAVRAVKKGGMVVAFEPNPLNPFYYPWYLWRDIRDIKGVSRWQAEKGMVKATNIWSLKKLFRGAGMKQVKIERDALLPNRFGNRFPFVFKLNDFLLGFPLIEELSAFIWIKGKKEKS